MQMLLATDASALVFIQLFLLNTSKCYVSLSLRCLHGLHLSITYRCPQRCSLSYPPLLSPLEVNGLSYLWIIACFLGSSSFLYKIAGFYFPQLSYRFIPLKSIQGLTQIIWNLNFILDYIFMIAYAWRIHNHDV